MSALPSAVTGKVEALDSHLRGLSPVLVAFSGGVDSTVLLCAALAALGREAVLAVTAQGDVHNDEETDRACAAAARMGADHLVVRTQELALPGFADNPPERCYLCKHALYSRLRELATERGFRSVVDGANSDDCGDYRPGMEAAKELGVVSPLAIAGLGKGEVRALAREWGLPEWQLPSSPCLASRFPYGQRITSEGLAMVREAEGYIRGLGFKTVRVRHHVHLARIEVPLDDIPRLLEAGGVAARTGPPDGRGIVGHLRSLGYRHVSVDMEGFRSGSLNEALEGRRAEEEGG